LFRLGHEVHVVALSEGPNSERLQASGARLHWLSARGNHDPWIFGQFVRTMHAVRPDVVQVWLLQMEILGGLAATVLRLPWILSERASTMAYPPCAKHWVRVRVARSAAGIVSNSSAGDAYWRARVKAGIARYVVPNALPVAEIDATSPAAPEEMGIEAGEQVVLFAGRFSGQKNLGVLVTALRRVLAQPKTVAVLCGEGALRARVERQLAEHGIRDRVRFPGYVEDIWRWMKRADVFVAPSLFEGHPNAVLEAMACGCPLVVSDIPAHREFLDQTTALLVDPHDAEALALAVLDALAAPAAAWGRARNARARVTAFSAPVVARRYARSTRPCSRPAAATGAECREERPRMSVRPRVLFLGADSCDADLVTRWAAAGHLLLDAMLQRLEDPKWAAPPTARREAVRRFWRRVPFTWRRTFGRIPRAILHRAETRRVAAGRRGRRVFAVPDNNEQGAIRVNLIGRDAHGRVQPGAEYEAVLAYLREALLEVENVETGEPIVTGFQYPPTLHRGPFSNDLPGMTVEWNRSRPIRKIRSPRLGVIEGTSHTPRTGDHKPDGLLFVLHPGVTSGECDRIVDAIDLAPTITSLLGVPYDGFDGTPVPEILVRWGA